MRETKRKQTVHTCAHAHGHKHTPRKTHNSTTYLQRSSSLSPPSCTRCHGQQIGKAWQGQGKGTRRLTKACNDRITTSRGHSKAWESVSPTQGASPKRLSPHPELNGPHQSKGIRSQLEGRHQSVGVRTPNSRGPTKAWESISPTQGPTPKGGSSCPPLKGPHQSVGVRIPNLTRHTKVWESRSSTQHPRSNAKRRIFILGPKILA